jgi:hypothetical protein
MEIIMKGGLKRCEITRGVAYGPIGGDKKVFITILQNINNREGGCYVR